MAMVVVLLYCGITVNVSIQSYGSSYRCGIIQADGLRWRIIGFYGHPEAALRPRSWALLRHLSLVSNIPWLVMGDFNEITRLEEKSSGDDRNATQMVEFRDALLDCSLQDLGFVGAEFTWSNKRDHQELIRVRLDRGVATGTWRHEFPLASIRHLVVSSSDHMGLIMDTTSAPVVQQGNWRRKRLFRFEKSWLREPGCEDVIADVGGATNWYCNVPCFAENQTMPC
jgi:hypothetical protein